VKGITEQLGPTSKMAWENQMVLDMILAEKRGCPDWGRLLHIHPQQHSSRQDHSQSTPRPDIPVKQTG
jgi:hypothetical protein